MEGVHVVGTGPEGLGDGIPQVGSRSKASVGGLKLKQNVKLVYNF